MNDSSYHPHSSKSSGNKKGSPFISHHPTKGLPVGPQERKGSFPGKPVQYFVTICSGVMLWQKMTSWREHREGRMSASLSSIYRSLCHHPLLSHRQGQHYWIEDMTSPGSLQLGQSNTISARSVTAAGGMGSDHMQSSPSLPEHLSHQLSPPSDNLPISMFLSSEHLPDLSLSIT